MDPSWSHLFVETDQYDIEQCRPVEPAGNASRRRASVLPTTSTGDDDVALEVKNAANGNLIHAASGVMVPTRILTAVAEPRKGFHRSLTVGVAGASLKPMK